MLGGQPLEGIGLRKLWNEFQMLVRLDVEGEWEEEEEWVKQWQLVMGFFRCDCNHEPKLS